jgi:hypothetical protein
MQVTRKCHSTEKTILVSFSIAFACRSQSINFADDDNEKGIHYTVL